MRTALAWLRERRGRRRERWDLVFEHLALQHQIRILQRSGTRRPRLTPWDRLFWLILSRLWSRWRGSLIIVQPGTVLKWRRQGLSLVFGRRHHGRRREKPKGMVGAWNYACPCDRLRMPPDTAPELLTSVLHHHCRVPFHMLPDYLQR